MVEKLKRWGIEFAFKLLIQPVDRNEFDFNPADVNAYYWFMSNSIKRNDMQVWCGHATTDALIDAILTDPHVLVKYRVNQVLANQPEFAAAFNCAIGTQMNPTERCAVW
ncbi:unnamed protein product [Angiostrongylus costaricensis]|uniref:Peptidase_M13 domain-containing protein n=1 Tax=Angiostrongylus costaricensis TaxID=334426 RepID=A0A0R3Q203_ANGCS|nr:unnamed protein product [Angiostrongylus costaricensis]